jgi:hypothetical protein
VYPAGYRVKFLPATIREHTPWFDVTAEYRRLQDRIVFHQELSWLVSRVEPAEYAGFKRSLEMAARKLKQHIVLEEK